MKIGQDAVGVLTAIMAQPKKNTPPLELKHARMLYSRALYQAAAARHSA